jgi:hypothetical protein
MPCVKVYKRRSQKIASKDILEFLQKRLSLTVKHILFAQEESGIPLTTYTYGSQ